MELIPVNPAREDGSKKLVYCTRNAKIVSGNSLLQKFHVDHIDTMVLVSENYVHDDWHSGRSGQILSVLFNDTHNAVDIETHNSIYRVIDNSIQVDNFATTRIESLFEATFVPGTSTFMPTYAQLLAMLETHEDYQLVKHDDVLINMLIDASEPDRSGHSDFLIRLMYRAPLRRFLVLYRERGGVTHCNLDFGRM